MPPQPIFGQAWLRPVVLTLAVGGFFVLFGVFIFETLVASKDDPAEFLEWWVRFGTGLGASLGALFAALLGIKAKTDVAAAGASSLIERIGEAVRRLGPDGYQKWVMTVGVWGYLAVGIVCAIVWGIKRNMTPEVIRNQAAILAGAITATLAAVVSPEE